MKKMNIIILGGDGYLGWPTAMHLASQGHNISVIDNSVKRKITLENNIKDLFLTPTLNERSNIFYQSSGLRIKVYELDCAIHNNLVSVIRECEPEVIIHYAEQASAAYSMKGFKEADFTLKNNLITTFNLIWAVNDNAPNCHIIKLGTMGEYGTPNIDIEEGWINIEHKNREETFLYPRQGGSLYHTTKVLDTDLLWFYTRNYSLRVTDLMQGPVYGFLTDEMGNNRQLLTNFYYDDIFGTVLNRFLVQAVTGIPLTVYGDGSQTRGYLNLKDVMQCINIAVNNPAKKGELRIFNQFTELFSVNDLANKVLNVGNDMKLNVSIENIKNPRKEKENHYYKASNTSLLDLGLKPNFLTDETLEAMITFVLRYKKFVDKQKIMPKVSW
jgi:UDP-sulfoquinovose synthase